MSVLDSLSAGQAVSREIIVFGEVLFDVFPDGRRVLGGAPFNVAWHLQGFGLSPLFVSRVRPDTDGSRVLETMKSWGMSRAEVQIDAKNPTGEVQVTIENGEPSFRIDSDQAYDFVDSERLMGLGESSARLLYHGSLAIRSDISWRALERLGQPPDGVVCDLNLRAPWWTRARAEWCLSRVTWLKMNSDELAELTGLPSTDDEACLRSAKQLKRQFEVPNLVITRGDRGALGLFARAEPIWQDAAVRQTVVDTVGAGDALSAVLILGIRRGWARSVILGKAAEFAAEICGRRGATAPDRSLYLAFDSPE